MLIETKYELQQIIYLKTDIEQYKRMIVGINVRPTGIQYQLAFGSSVSWHDEMEMSEEVNLLVKQQ